MISIGWYWVACLQPKMWCVFRLGLAPKIDIDTVTKKWCETSWWSFEVVHILLIILYVYFSRNRLWTVTHCHCNWDTTGLLCDCHRRHCYFKKSKGSLRTLQRLVTTTIIVFSLMSSFEMIDMHFPDGDAFIYRSDWHKTKGTLQIRWKWFKSLGKYFCHKIYPHNFSINVMDFTDFLG